MPSSWIAFLRKTSANKSLKTSLKAFATAGVMATLLPLSAAEIHFHTPHGGFGENNGAGGIQVVADLDGDGFKDIVVAQSNKDANDLSVERLAAYNHLGRRLWLMEDAQIQVEGKNARDGLPGLHGSGVQVADVDNDGIAEIVYVTDRNRIRVVDGATGAIEGENGLPTVTAANRREDKWHYVHVANLRGQGTSDVILQTAENRKGNGPNHDIVSAYVLDDLLNQANPTPLWERNDFLAPAHGPAWVADLDLDGRDELVGISIISPTGEELIRVLQPGDSRPHADSIAVGDIIPSRPGLEVAVPFQYDDQKVYCYDEKGIIWAKKGPGIGDGDKLTLGDFDPSRPGLELYFRGPMKKADNTGVSSFVLDANGDVIAIWKYGDFAPAGWDLRGIDQIWPIHWDGSGKQHLLLTERGAPGDYAIVEPLTGEFVKVFSANNNRIVATDMIGDWREDIIAFDADFSAQIISNGAPNPHPAGQRMGDLHGYYYQVRNPAQYYSTGSGGAAVLSGGQAYTNSAPTAAISANVTAGPAPLTVTFSAAGSSDPDDNALGYLWDMDEGNGSTIGDGTATHTFLRPGTYEVLLTAHDGDLGDTTSLVITVGEDPGTFAKDDFDSGFNGGTGFTGAWTGSAKAENGAARFENKKVNLKRTVSIPQDEAIRLDFDFRYSNTVERRYSFQIKAIANGTATVIDTIDDFGRVEFTPFSLDLSPFAGQTIDLSFELPGNLSGFVKLDLDNIVMVASDSGPINQAPSAGLSVNPLVGDAPLVVNADARSSSDPEGETLTYFWDIGNGFVVGNAQESFTFNDFGDHTIRLKVNDGALDSAVISETVTVTNTANEPPTIITLSATDTTVTTTTTTLLVEATDPEDDALTYNWALSAAPSGADPQIGSGQNPNVVFDQAGSYEFTITINDGFNPAVSQSIAIIVAQQASDLVIETP